MRRAIIAIAFVVGFGASYLVPPAEAQQRVEMDAVRALKDIARETRLLRQEVAAIRRRCNDPIGGI